MDKNTSEQNKKRFIELSEKSYNESRCLFTDFLNEADMADFNEVRGKLYPCGIRIFEGFDGSSRAMIGFGDEENLGYEEDFPVKCMLIRPKAMKFAEDLSHRDYLGSLMNLGIERSSMGDLTIHDKSACFYCRDEIADLIMMELERVRHTPVVCRILEKMPSEYVPKGREEDGIIQSLRMDSLVAKIFHISREEAKRLIQAEKVLRNGRVEKNPSAEPKPSDIISARGFGKARFLQISGETRKGRLSVSWMRYI